MLTQYYEHFCLEGIIYIRLLQINTKNIDGIQQTTMQEVFIKGENRVSINPRYSRIILAKKGVLWKFLLCLYSKEVPTHTLNGDLFLII